jgi:hypothetical protein
MQFDESEQVARILEKSRSPFRVLFPRLKWLGEGFFCFSDASSFIKSVFE